MVLASLKRQLCLSTNRQSKDQLQIASFRLTCSGYGGLLRYTRSARWHRVPYSLVTRSGPNKRSGRFKRIHAEASLPHNPAPSSPDTHDFSSSPNPPNFKFGWPLLLSVAVACFLLRRVTAPSKARHELTPNQAAVAMVSETPHPSTPLHWSATASGQQQQQQPQQAFASISSAGFAKLFSGAQRAHLAQLMVYQAQRVRLFLSQSSTLGCDCPPRHLNCSIVTQPHPSTFLPSSPPPPPCSLSILHPTLSPASSVQLRHLWSIVSPLLRFFQPGNNVHLPLPPLAPQGISRFQSTLK